LRESRRRNSDRLVLVPEVQERQRRRRRIRLVVRVREIDSRRTRRGLQRQPLRDARIAHRLVGRRRLGYQWLDRQRIRRRRLGRRRGPCRGRHFRREVHRRIQPEHFRPQRLGLGVLARAYTFRVRPPELGQRLVLPVVRDELPRQQLPHLRIRNRVRELAKRVERLRLVAGPQHVLRVLEEPPPRIHHEALRCAEPPEPQVQLGAPRHVPQRLAAQGDRVVVEPRFRVPVGRLLVVPDRLLLPPQPQVEVADPVVDAQLRLPLALVSRTQDLEIELDRLLPFFALLVQTRLVLQFDDRLHLNRTRSCPSAPPGAPPPRRAAAASPFGWSTSRGDVTRFSSTVIVP